MNKHTATATLIYNNTLEKTKLIENKQTYRKTIDYFTTSTTR